MSRNEFEHPFKQREYIQTPYGDIETYDIRPIEPITDVPVLFAPGWRETPELQKGCLYHVYRDQRRVIGLLHTFVTHPPKEQSDLPIIEAQKAQTLLAVLHAKGIDKTDVITHSEGAINVAIAASLEPQRFRNLVLVTPAGLTGRDSLTRVALGFAQHMIEPGFFSSHRTTDHESVRRPKTPFFRNIETALNEGKAITSFDIHPLLMHLRDQGIGIAVLVGKKDTVFPLKRVVSHLSQQANDPNYGFDIFATKEGGHELYPRPEEVMPQILDLLHRLEDKET